MSEARIRPQRDLIILGAGAGGLVVASVASQLGLDVVLIEKNSQLGGDCLHYGCVPSKALLKIAQVADTIRRASEYGLEATAGEIDIKRVNAAIRRAVDAIQPHDSHARFEAMGCEIITGEASFIDAHSVQVNGQRLGAKKFVIATGSEAAIPQIDGLDAVDYLTSDDMYSLPVLPPSLLVLGAGPVGVEMAQAYARLGSRVTLVEVAPHILPGMDADIGAVLSQQLARDGVEILTGQGVEKVSRQGDGVELVLADRRALRAGRLLVATGRRPRLHGLGLARAGVGFDERGIAVNDRMQTSVKHIYACGDVTGRKALTHVAEQQAGVVIANIVFKIPKKIDNRVVPEVVYTEPECASIGLTESDLEKHDACEVVRFEMSALDRAIADNATAGFARLIVRRGRLLGAQIVGPHAGEVIHELALAMSENIKLSKITALVHAYPTYAQVSKRAAGMVYSPALFGSRTRKLVGWLQRLLP